MSTALPTAQPENVGLAPDALQPPRRRAAEPGGSRPHPRRRGSGGPARQGGIPPGVRRARPGGPRADADRRDLPHLLDDQADRLGRCDDAVGGRPLAAERSGRPVPAGVRRAESRRAAWRGDGDRAGGAADHRAGPAAPHLRPDLRIPRHHAGAQSLHGGQGGSAEADQRRPGRPRSPRCRCCTSPARDGSTAAPPTCSGGWSK